MGPVYMREAEVHACMLILLPLNLVSCHMHLTLKYGVHDGHTNQCSNQGCEQLDTKLLNQL